MKRWMQPILMLFLVAMVCSMTGCDNGGNADTGNTTTTTTTANTETTVHAASPVKKDDGTAAQVSADNPATPVTPPASKGSSKASMTETDDSKKDGERMEEEHNEQNYTEAELSIESLRDTITGNNQFAATAAYIGYCELDDLELLPNWIRKNNQALAEALPFLTEIPQERMIGGGDRGYGRLFCILPRDKDTSIAVNRVSWEEGGNGMVPVSGEVLYRDETGLPILVFSNSIEPDIEVVLVTNDGLVVTWYPQCDDLGSIVLPNDEKGLPTIMDFSTYGEIDGSDDLDTELLPGWLPPTAEGLADTTWNYDKNGEQWCMDLHRGSTNPEFFGTVEIGCQKPGEERYEILYTGFWKMDDNYLYLMMADTAGNRTGISYPVEIDPSGENLYIEANPDSMATPPFMEKTQESAIMTISLG